MPLDKLDKVHRGRCTGCDKVRVRYRYNWKGITSTNYELYCAECLRWHVGDKIAKEIT